MTHEEHWSKGITLVIGGTGKTGRRVADRLVEADRKVRIGSRTATLPFDWEQQDTWEKALQGVKAAYVAYQPDLSVPGALATVEAFFDQAIASGVEKLVLLSGRGEVEAERAEQALQATSVDWTILRSSWFCQNFSESFFLDPILAGQVALPVGSVAEPFVDIVHVGTIGNGGGLHLSDYYVVAKVASTQCSLLTSGWFALSCGCNRSDDRVQCATELCVGDCQTRQC